jgi:hypothetical protein
VFYDTLIWELSLDDNLQKLGMASRSEPANLQAGGRGFESHHLHGVAPADRGTWLHGELPSGARLTEACRWREPPCPPR